MINSTLSDRLRRMESDLAVAASRAKVETVVGILEAGARASPAVFLEAPPYGLFMGFGDGNLNYRSCAWINRHEDAMCIANSGTSALGRVSGQNAVGLGGLWTINDHLAMFTNLAAGTTAVTPIFIGYVGFAWTP